MGTLQKFVGKYLPFLKAMEKLEKKRVNPNKEKALAQQNLAYQRNRFAQIHAFGGCQDSNTQAIFIPKHTKRKYWMV